MGDPTYRKNAEKLLEAYKGLKEDIIRSGWDEIAAELLANEILDLGFSKLKKIKEEYRKKGLDPEDPQYADEIAKQMRPTEEEMQNIVAKIKKMLEKSKNYPV